MTDISPPPHDPYTEALAKRLLAAWMTGQLGLKSIDYTLKNYVLAHDDQPLGEFWLHIARYIRANAMKDDPPPEVEAK